MTKLHECNVEKISMLVRTSRSTMNVFEYIEKTPIIDIKKTSVELGVAYNTVAKAVERLVDLNILEKTGGSQRSRYYAYQEYLNILRKDT